MNIHHKASFILAAGKSGMGKTSIGIRYINGSPHDRVFIFDHRDDEFATRMGIGRRQVATDFDEMIELAAEQRIVPFDFTRNYAGRKKVAFAEFCDVVYDIAGELEEKAGLQTLLVSDEIQHFVTPHECPPEFQAIVETGRKRNLDGFFLSQRPNKINGDIREQLTEMFLFRLTDENSLKFAQEAGANTDRVQKLEPLEYLYFNLVNGREKSDRIVFAKKNLPSGVSVSA